VIADYALVRPLGPSTYGDLFLVRAPVRLGLGGTEVVINVLPDAASEWEFTRFALEMQALASVSDPHLVSILDAGQAPGRLFYAFTHQPLGALADHLGDGGPDQVHRGVRAVHGAALGAHALHDAGITHRDISPRTIYLTDGSGILADLGLADILRAGMTSTGTGPLGGLEYAAPELLRGERTGRSSDVWSLAATLHRVVTGRSLRPDLPRADIVTAIRHALAVPPMIADSCPSTLREVIAQAIDPDPAIRYRDAAAFARALDSAVAS
jgi:eukaryotic-like serine/threonine-protein kinase